jgi:hypothetical protein
MKAAKNTSAVVSLPSKAEILKEVSYDYDSGNFTRNKTNKVMTSKTSSGYVQFRIGGKKYLAHRIAWKLHYAKDPDFDIDHVNGNRTDNRIENLRLASASQNAAFRKPSADHGIKGVTLVRGLWVAEVKINGKKKRAGSSKCQHCAAKMYNEAARLIHGEFAWLNPETMECSACGTV